MLRIIIKIFLLLPITLWVNNTFCQVIRLKEEYDFYNDNLIKYTNNAM